MLRGRLSRHFAGLGGPKSCVIFTASFLGLACSQALSDETLSLTELRSAYELPQSQYMLLDGIDVHFTDEYSGSPVLLLHASGLNLRAWDSLAQRLGKRHRVIRLDWPASGLTGPDPRQAESIDRYLSIVQQLLDELNLDHVDVIGTSTGGITAFQLAAKSPERVSRLILINAAGLPRTADTNPNQSRATLAPYDGLKVRPMEYYETYFSMIFKPPYAPPEWLLQMTYDIDRRDGIRDEQNRFLNNFKTGDPKTVLSQITAPTLILWGAGEQALLHPEQADRFQSWMPNAPSLVVKYPGLGHYPYLEEPALVERDIAAFLAGDLDAQLRR